MIVKLAGALLILAGCCGIVYFLSHSHKRVCQMTLQLIEGLEQMEYLLQYRQTSLPDMFRCLKIDNGPLKQFFWTLSSELEDQISPNVEYCVNAALGKTTNIPEALRKFILRLGKNFGQFALAEQIKSLQSIRKECESYLRNQLNNCDVRIRTYQTFVFCAGAVIVLILL